MENNKLSAILSLTTSVVILIASFFQWWNITYNGQMLTKKWVKVLFIFCIAVLSISLLLIVL